jgi:hypothetical protein
MADALHAVTYLATHTWLAVAWGCVLIGWVVSRLMATRKTNAVGSRDDLSRNNAIQNASAALGRGCGTIAWFVFVGAALFLIGAGLWWVASHIFGR